VKLHAGWPLAVAAGLVLTTGAVADSDLDRAIREALAVSNLTYARIDRGAYVVVFTPDQAEVERWSVFVEPAPGDRWVLIYATLIDGERGHAYSEALMRRALAYNSSTAGSKLGIDPEMGDLDVQIEIPAAYLTPPFLRDAVLDVAATCDRIHGAYRKMVQ
jgi:hypothetical protein